MNGTARKSNGRLAVAAGAVAAFAIAVYFGTRGVVAQQQEAPPSSLMQMKLQHAQAMLGAVAVEDYERIGTSARRLSELSIEAQWTRPGSAMYGVYGDQFRAALADVEKQVEKMNIEGVTLNFFQVVMACVKCHEAIRAGQDVAALGLPEEWGIVENLLDKPDPSASRTTTEEATE